LILHPIYLKAALTDNSTFEDVRRKVIAQLGAIRSSAMNRQSHWIDAVSLVLEETARKMERVVLSEHLRRWLIKLRENSASKEELEAAHTISAGHKPGQERKDLTEFYDVAISFAGEDRAFAQALANLLVERDIRVFYDLYEEARLWGKNLHDHLEWVYKDAARYCIILVSESYVTRVWTELERRSAQARAFSQDKEYILPIRLDDTEVPGILQTVGYVDARTHTVEDIASLISEKLHY
jgi:hypothetical protein